jgi:hypothetical protein
LAKIDVPRIATMRLTQRRSQSVFVPGHHDQVHVIWHQAPGPDFGARLPGKLAQEFDVVAIVVLLEKRSLTAVSALSHVVGISGYDDARHARHGLPPCKSIDLEC